jgi:hypothetical protein
MCFHSVVFQGESVGIVLVHPEPTDPLPMNRATRKRRSRLLVEGPLAPYFDAYGEYLANQGYSQVSYWKKTFLISEFSRWLGRKGISVGEITAAHEEAFLRHRARRRRLIGGDRIALSGATGWLQEKGIVECKATASVETSAVEQVLQEYRSHLREDRGLAPTTIEVYAGYVRCFLTDISGEDELRLAASQPDCGLYPAQSAAGPHIHFGETHRHGTALVLPLRALSRLRPYRSCCGSAICCRMVDGIDPESDASRLRSGSAEREQGVANAGRVAQSRHPAAACAAWVAGRRGRPARAGRYRLERRLSERAWQGPCGTAAALAS